MPLPLVPEKFGLRLPPERYCLSGPNYRIKHKPKQVTHHTRVFTCHLPGGIHRGIHCHVCLTGTVDDVYTCVGFKVASFFCSSVMLLYAWMCCI